MSHVEMFSEHVLNIIGSENQELHWSKVIGGETRCEGYPLMLFDLYWFVFVVLLIHKVPLLSTQKSPRRGFQGGCARTDLNNIYSYLQDFERLGTQAEARLFHIFGLLGQVFS